MSKSARAVAVALAWLLVAPLRAHAEGPTHSTSVWTITGHRVEVRLWMPLALLTRFGATADGGELPSGEALTRSSWLAGEYLTGRMTLASDGGACIVTGAEPTAGTIDAGWLMQTWQLDCPSVGGWTLRDDAFFEDAPSHAHLARVRFASPTSTSVPDATPAPPLEHVFTTGERTWRTGARDTGRASGGGWLVQALVARSLAILGRGAPLLAVLLVAAAASPERRTLRRLGAVVCGLVAGGVAAGSGRVAMVGLPEVLAVVLAVALDPFARALGGRWAATSVLGLVVLSLVIRTARTEIPGSAINLWVMAGVCVIAVTSWMGKGAPWVLDAIAGLLVALVLVRAAPHGSGLVGSAPVVEVVIGGAALGLSGVVLAMIAALVSRIRIGGVVSAGSLAVVVAWVLASVW